MARAARRRQPVQRCQLRSRHLLPGLAQPVDGSSEGRTSQFSSAPLRCCRASSPPALCAAPTAPKGRPLNALGPAAIETWTVGGVQRPG